MKHKLYCGECGQFVRDVNIELKDGVFIEVQTFGHICNYDNPDDCPICSKIEGYCVYNKDGVIIGHRNLKFGVDIDPKINA